MDTSQRCSGKRPESSSAEGLKQARLPAMCLNIDFSSMLSQSLRLLPHLAKHWRKRLGLSLPTRPFIVNTEGF